MIKSAIATASLFFFSGCSNDDVSDTTTKLSIAESSIHSRAKVTIADSKGNEFSLNEARVALRHIQFDEIGDNSYEISGPFVVDLLTGISTPEIISTDIPAGEYSRIDVRIDDTDEDFIKINSDDPLFEYSLYAKGTFGDSESFELKLKFNEDARFDFETPYSITAETDNQFNLSLNISEWFSEIDLSDCLSEHEDGKTLLISDEYGTCPDVEGDLKTAIKTMYDFDKE